MALTSKDGDDFSGKLSLRIPKSLHKQISEQAEFDGCSINQLIMMYISMGIGNEFGKKQYNITVNTDGISKIEELQREKWSNYNNRIYNNTSKFDFNLMENF